MSQAIGGLGNVKFSEYTLPKFQGSTNRGMLTHPTGNTSGQCVHVRSFSHIRLFMTLWTVTHQVPLSTGFFRQEYWSGLPLPSPGDLPIPGIESASPALAGGFFTLSHLRNP